MFEYNGTEFTLEQVEKAATAKGLSADEYISTYNIVKKDKDEEEVKTEAVVEDEIAPAMAETVDTGLQSVPGLLGSPRLNVGADLEDGLTPEERLKKKIEEYTLKT